MGFDLASFGAGAVTGVVGSAVGYQAWQRWQAMREREEHAAEPPQRPATSPAGKTVEDAYTEALIDFCQRTHLMGHRINLSEVLIEPRFIRTDDLVTLPDEDDMLRSVFEQVPRVHDYPHLHAPYHLPTLSIDDLSRGERRIAIVGEAGSGRTTALLAIALWSLERVAFALPPDPVQQRLNEAERALTAEERAERIKQRVALMQRAQERYAEEKNKAASEVVDPGLYGFGDDAPTERPTFRSREPIYVHLADILPYTGEYGRRVDPAEPLIRALQAQVGWLAAKRIVARLYRLLKAGKALLLVDGLDDVPADDQADLLAWLQAFIRLYDRNAVVIAASFENYGTLHLMGVVPVFLRPWSTQQIRSAAEQWAARWTELSEQPLALAEADLEAHIARAHIQYRAQPAFERVLAMWTTYAGSGGSQSQQLQQYIADRLPDAAGLMSELQHLAVMQLDEGYIRLARLVEIAVQEVLAASRAKLEAQLGADTSDDGDEVRDQDAIEKTLAREERQHRREYTQHYSALLRQLTAAGLLMRHRDGRFRFQHRFVSGYLAAQSLINVDEATATSTLQNPDWRDAIPFLLQNRPLDSLTAQIVSAPMDIQYDTVLQLTRWLPYVGMRSVWRGHLLQYLGNQMVADNQFALLRERIAAALVSSRDTGALIVFRRTLQHPNADVRYLACLGLGALFDEEATAQLADMAIQDPDEHVQIAAALALGAFGTEKALIKLAEFLELAENPNVRRAASESFAAYPEMGYPTLHDALRERDMLIRRAAVFGLGRVPAPWALIDINAAYLEDDEWYVRIAAQVALGDVYETSLKGVQHYPDVTEVGWLKAWRADQVKAGNIPHDLEGLDVLDYALQQPHDPLAKVLALLTVGQIGLYDKVDTLYEALRDRQSHVRDAAYRALAMFQDQLSEPLPAPA